MKPILSLDFDGVIHSYSSGWQGPRAIPDPPVPGALEFIVTSLDSFEVNIFSSRSNHFGGRRAMKKWLQKHYIELAPTWAETPIWLRIIIAESAFADTWDLEVSWKVKKIIKQIKFPTHKPPALVTIDDRALCFTGEWPTITELHEFKPWYKKE